MDVGKPDPPFVGRDAELAEIRSCAADAGVPGVLLVAGYGAGKTELARHLSAAFAADGWRTEWVTGSRSAATVPFGAVAHLLPAQWRGDGPPVWVLRVIEERFARNVVGNSASQDSTGGIGLSEGDGPSDGNGGGSDRR